MTGFGLVVGGATALGGADQFQAGLRQAITGETTPTFAYQATLNATHNPTAAAIANLGEASLGGLANAAGKAATAAKDAEELGNGLLAGCFPADTWVSAENGLRPIQSMRAGEKVWAYDLVADTWALRRIVETYEHEYEGDLIELTIAGEIVEATGNHPFWVVDGEGLDRRSRPEHVPAAPPDARAPGRWVDAAGLTTGDVLLLQSGLRTPVTAVLARQIRQPVYNFQVEELHTYAVGKCQVLVHNKAASNPFAGVPSFSNQLPGQLSNELAAAARVGAGPVAFGEPAFDAAVNSGTIKFVVNKTGQVLITPHTVNGTEISHAVLSNGYDVLAAGQADIVAANGQYLGLNITNYSGHFMPSAESLSVRARLLAGSESTFPDWS